MNFDQLQKKKCISAINIEFCNNNKHHYLYSVYFVPTIYLTSKVTVGCAGDPQNSK